MKPVRVGVVGCGNISDIYFENAKKFKSIEIAGCADLDKARAVDKAQKHELPKAYSSVKQLLADKSIELVLNLTIPAAHGEVNLAALRAGKHVYCEKPFALTREQGQEVLALADKKGLLVGCAPDTFLGAGIQTARKLIDDGWIGEPVSATAFMQCHGHENWHPDPEFFYQAGGGPMFDMGPYYLTALVTLLGPAKRVTGSTRITFPERTITSEKKNGQKVRVEIPTHVAGLIDFAQGAIATIVTSFDVWAHHLPCIEIHGTLGSMGVGDPNGFGSPLKVIRAGAPSWGEVPHTHAYAGNSRCVGVADMACAIRTGRQHRANGAMAYHVLDIMHAFHDASDSGRHVKLKSACKRPAPMPIALRDWELDA